MMGVSPGKTRVTVQHTVKISFAFPGRPRQLVAFQAIKESRQLAASAMMLLRERAGYRGGLTIESGGARGRQAAPPSPPLYGMASLPVTAVTNGALPLAVGAGAGPGRGRRRGYAKQGVVLPRDWSARRRGGTGALRGGAQRRQRNPARGHTCPGGQGQHRGYRGRGAGGLREPCPAEPRSTLGL